MGQSASAALRPASDLVVAFSAALAFRIRQIPRQEGRDARHRPRASFALGTRRLRILGTVSAVAITAALTLTGSGTFAAPLAGSVDPVAAATATPAILAPPDAIVGESDGSVDFVVRLAEEGTDTVTVNFQTVSGTAGGGNGICNSDFVHKNGTLTFTPGQTEKIVPIVITDCLDDEVFEGFTLELSGPTGGGVIARASQRISIVDDDNDTVDSPHLFVRDAVVDEKDRLAFVSVILGGANGQTSLSTVTVDYQTSNGTASAGSDFSARSGEFNFSPGRDGQVGRDPDHRRLRRRRSRGVHAQHQQPGQRDSLRSERGDHDRLERRSRGSRSRPLSHRLT